MAWNDPNNQKPWGSGQNQTPPELDEIIRKLKSKFDNLFKDINKNVIDGGNGSGDDNGKNNTRRFKGIGVFLVIAVIVWLAFGVYIVGPAEKGVELRFGKFSEITSEGPHWHLPYPIETVTTVNVSQIRTADIGFRSGLNAKNVRVTGNIGSESLMLTKDENIIDAKFAVQYRINDAVAYLFNVVNPDLTLRQVSESVIRQVIGKNNMDFILTEGRTEIAQQIAEEGQKLLNLYKTGLQITTVNMQDAQPPEQVQSAFSDAVKAREDKERLINEAEAYSNDILPKARGLSARIIEESKAYKSQVISKAEGEAQRFDKIRVEFEKAPVVTKQRLYLETLEQVFMKTTKVIMDSNSNSLMYLPLDKILSTSEESKKIAEPVQKNQQSQETQNKRPNLRNLFRNRETR